MTVANIYKRLIGKLKEEGLKNNIVIISVIVIGMAIRIFFAYCHFPHEDDIAVAFTLKNWNRAGFGSYWKEIFNAYWTYAPLQFVLDYPLIDFRHPYSVNLFLSRLPSVLFGCMSIVTAYILADNLQNTISNKKRKIILLFAVAMVSFSWENIVYSAQAEPYEVGVFCSFILLLLGSRKGWIEKNTFAAGLVGILLAGFCYAQYQLFILCFSFYLTYLIIILREGDRRKLLRWAIAAFLTLLVCIPLLYRFYLGMSDGANPLLSRGVNWNAGINGRFLFNMPSGNIFSKFGYLLYFWIWNSLLIIRYYFTFDFGNISILVGGVFLILMLIGFIEIHRNRSKYFFALYSDITIMIFVILVIMGKLSYGPSRHMLVVYPMMFFLMIEGIAAFFVWTKDLYGKRCWYFFIGIYMTCFLISIPQQYKMRRNYFSESYIEKMTLQYTPAAITTYGRMYDLSIMNFDNYINYFMNFSIAKFEGTPYIFENDDLILVLGRGECFTNSYMGEVLASLQRYDESVNTIEYVSTIVDTIVGSEVEYASSYYQNHPNGMSVYLYRIKK